MLRIAFRCIGAVTVLLLLAHLADVAMWRIRVAQGDGFEAVPVSHVGVATLKAGKEEYYSEGTGMQTCPRRLFPAPAAQGWDVPCWWLVRHPQQVTHY